MDNAMYVGQLKSTIRGLVRQNMALKNALAIGLQVDDQAISTNDLVARASSLSNDAIMMQDELDTLRRFKAEHMNKGNTDDH